MRNLNWSGWCCLGVIVGIRAGAPDDPAMAAVRSALPPSAVVRAKLLVNDSGAATLWINRRVGGLDEPLALKLPSRRLWLECLHSPLPIELRVPASEQSFEGTNGVGVACMDIAAGRYRIRPHDDGTQGPSHSTRECVELRVTG